MFTCKRSVKPCREMLLFIRWLNVVCEAQRRKSQWTFTTHTHTQKHTPPSPDYTVFTQRSPSQVPVGAHFALSLMMLHGLALHREYIFSLAWFQRKSSDKPIVINIFATGEDFVLKLTCHKSVLVCLIDSVCFAISNNQSRDLNSATFLLLVNEQS